MYVTNRIKSKHTERQQMKPYTAPIVVAVAAIFLASASGELLVAYLGIAMALLGFAINKKSR